jgi:hypothetical protein
VHLLTLPVLKGQRDGISLPRATAVHGADRL